MKKTIQKTKNKLIQICTILVLLITLLPSCNKEELDIQTNFDFAIKVMPVPKEISNGQTAEIRIDIEPFAEYTDTQYYLRYFQFDGQGSLRYYQQPAFLPNDLYLLTSKQFRLYYTSNSSVTQSFEVWICDNFGNEKQLHFQFNSSD